MKTYTIKLVSSPEDKNTKEKNTKGVLITIGKWLIIIAEILKLIAGGMDKTEAVGKVAAMFNVSEKSIWKHGGF